MVNKVILDPASEWRLGIHLKGEAILENNNRTPKYSFIFICRADESQSVTGRDEGAI